MEYIEKIMNGSIFDDMPIILSHQEHLLISTTLKNRLSFLYHNLELHQNALDFYKQIIKDLPQNINMKTLSFTINNGNNNSKTLTANNSTNVLLGDEVIYENSSDNSIKISNSYNKKKEQLSKLDELIQLLRDEKDIIDDIRQSLITNFDKIREELAEEEQPEKPKIYKWLSNTKKIAETIALSHKTAQAINWIYDSLNFIGHAMK